MADTMTPEQRSRCMAAIKGKDTKPEMIVRKYLFSRGLRYRLHGSKLPGKPDIVLKRYRTVVFIDGCFWHGHDGCRYFKMPKSNVEFWQHKISTNKSRDAVTTARLEEAGWKVIRLWECDIRIKSKRDEALSNLYDRITGKGSTGYEIDPADEDYSIAAEPPESYGCQE